MRKVLSLLMIFAGISIFFYPAAKDYYISYSQEKMIENWEGSGSQGNKVAAESLRELEEVFSTETLAESSVDKKQELEDAPAAETPADYQKLSAGMVGVIEIDKNWREAADFKWCVGCEFGKGSWSAGRNVSSRNAREQCHCRPPKPSLWKYVQPAR
ncbi:hypothetical protein [Mesobacillus boroniphilus]|uniref:Uncharacterized protein n=1 Tax=Mesobacillus boroniphilus JCM 21738 TaxID=1294265 RepID=W4RJH6_9BACI|nr:hypothetical protein [Mesobacillus boroniphilus]GAE44585.1 hypothetical protein JCM21738_1307 [Mesobacillus boroniphilus JCM 21738]